LTLVAIWDALLGVDDNCDPKVAIPSSIQFDELTVGKPIVVEGRGIKGQKLHIDRDQIEMGNHWIGIQSREEGGGSSPVGASVTVRTVDRTHVGRVATGETPMGQHPTTLQFGLAGSQQVESIKVPMGWRCEADRRKSGDRPPCLNIGRDGTRQISWSRVGRTGDRG
jgi:hypothetical protein